MDRPRIAVLMLLLCACGPEQTDTTGTGTGTTTGTSSPTTTTDTGDLPGNLLECIAPHSCGIILANSGDPGLPTPTDYTAAQRCALQQLAAAAPQRMHYNDGCEGNCTGALILIRGDASVIVEPYAGVSEGGVDLDGIQAELASLADSELCALKAPEYYEACLAAFDNACTSRGNWFAGCGEPAPAACEP
jgi:hypothetical protein